MTILKDVKHVGHYEKKLHFNSHTPKCLVKTMYLLQVYRNHILLTLFILILLKSENFVITRFNRDYQPKTEYQNDIYKYKCRKSYNYLEITVTLQSCKLKICLIITILKRKSQ